MKFPGRFGLGSSTKKSHRKIRNPEDKKKGVAPEPLPFFLLTQLSGYLRAPKTAPWHAARLRVKRLSTGLPPTVGW